MQSNNGLLQSLNTNEAQLTIIKKEQKNTDAFSNMRKINQ
jgi:hypothetical protein